MNAQGQAGQLEQLFGPGVLSGNTRQLFQMLMASPAFQSMLNNYSLQGNQLAQNMTSGLAQRGLTGTGIGTMANSMGNAVPGFMQTQARGQLFNQALMAAMQNLGQQQNSFTTLEYQRRQHPGFWGTLGGDLAGGLSQLIPKLGGNNAQQQQQGYQAPGYQGWSAGQNNMWMGPGLGG